MTTRNWVLCRIRHGRRTNLDIRVIDW
jgi:hypothetical protein